MDQILMEWNLCVVYVLILVLCFEGISKYGGAITWFLFKLI